MAKGKTGQPAVIGIVAVEEERPPGKIRIDHTIFRTIHRLDEETLVVDVNLSIRVVTIIHQNGVTIHRRVDRCRNGSVLLWNKTRRSVSRNAKNNLKEQTANQCSFHFSILPCSIVHQFLAEGAAFSAALSSV